MREDFKARGEDPHLLRASCGFTGTVRGTCHERMAALPSTGVIIIIRRLHDGIAA